MSKNNSGVVELFLLVLVFIIGFGLAWWVTNNEVIPASGPTPTPAPEKPVSSEITPTPEVTTYINTEFGYQLSYPGYLELFPAGYYPESEEISESPGISIQQNQEGHDKPLFKLYVMDRDNWKYQVSNARALAQFTLRENKESDIFVELVSDIEQTEFEGLEAYTYTIRSNGFEAGWESFVGAEGEIEFIIFEDNNLYYIIAFYDEKPFNVIKNTFELTNR